MQNFYNLLNSSKKLSLIMMLLLSIATFAQCPQSIVYLPATENQIATTSINGNNYRLGNSVMTLINTKVGSTGTFTNLITDTHQTPLGITISNSNISTFANRVESEISFTQPVYNLSFDINDVDDDDVIRVLAYNQNGVLIDTDLRYTLYPGTIITYNTAVNEFVANDTGVGINDDNGRITFNLNGLNVSRFVVQYYDLDGGGSYTIANLAATAVCANADSYSGTSGTASTTASVLANDFHLTAAATTSNVTPSIVGSWPSGISLNANGTISISNTVAAGTYNLNYRICSNTVPANCSSSTVTLTIAPNPCGTTDSDADGVFNICDLDDDNDGILDTAECNSSNRVSNGTFPTSGGNVNTLTGWTVGGTYASSGPWASPTGRIHLNGDGISFRRDASTVTTLSQNITGVISNSTINLNNIYWTKTFPSTTDIEYVFTISYANVVYATINSTSGNTPTVTANNGAAVNIANLPSVTATPALNAAIQSAKTNLSIQLPEGIPNTGNLLFTFTANSNPTEVRDLGFSSVSLLTCSDTDRDGTADYLDLDSDNDGCSDANEYYNNSNADGGDGGVYGTGTPTVDGTGKVTAASYTSTTAANVLSATQVTIGTQPYNISSKIGTTASFSVTALAASTTTFSSGTPNYTIPPATDTSSNINYQWQISTNNGSTWANVTNGGQFSGATTATLFVNNINLAQNGNRFRVLVSHSGRICTITSGSGTLAVVDPCVPSADYPDSDGDGVSNYCDKDDDNDGILDTEECPTYVTSPNIFVQSATGINSFNVETFAQTSYCAGNLNVTTDIAISTSGVMYGVYNTGATSSTLAIINSGNCSVTNVLNLPFSSNSLSFLPDGSLLVGSNGDSIIRRINLTTNTISVWRNYTSGFANGDFIFLNGKVYVLWFDTAINATNPFIREVTVNANYDFVSDTVLGPIQRRAFGLAKANGNELYAVTSIGIDGGNNPPGSIIRINLNPFSWFVVSNYPEGLAGATSIEEGARECDTDGDGIPNRLDLDSDGDGCSDAKEGAANFTAFSTSSMPGGNSGAGYNGLSSSPVTQNLGNTVDNNSTSASYGVPTVAGTGQAIGQSQNGFKNDCQDADADGIADWEDVDDDNDGMLDSTECTTTYNDFITAFGNGTTTNILPSDFGLALNVKNQNVTRDLSAKFGYPANSGAVIVSITNGSVHPSQNVWWTKNGQFPTIWKITGTMSAFVGMGNDLLYYANDSKTIHIYDQAPVIPVTAPGFVNQAAVAGQWSIIDTESQKTLNNLNTDSGTIENGNWRFVNMNFGPKSFGFSTTVANAEPNYAVQILLECDTDKDGIPDRVDLDSDADGCSDAIEGGADITNSQLVTAGGTLSGGSTSVNQNLCALITCVSTTGINIGLPQFTTVTTGYSSTTGQTIGNAQNALVSGCVCYENPGTSSNSVPVKHGITLLGRAGTDNGDWPMLRNSAYTALESKTKGFVITRMTSDPTQTSAANHINKISNPVIGMMVFDVFADSGKGCLKIYTGSGTGEGWKCFSTQGCPSTTN